MAGVTSNYTYDALYELTQVTQGTITTESYTYDPVGNRLTSQGVSSYSYNASNEMTAAGSVMYTYDNNGSALTRTDANGTTAYSWDFENRLTGVALPNSGGDVALKYDPFGRRVEKISPSFTSIFAFDGDNLVETVNSTGGTVALYADGQDIDEPLAELRGGTASFYLADGLGSITSMKTSAGSVAQTYTFDSFGRVTASTGSLQNPFRFTSREFDTETNLYYYRARYYDAISGRFLTEDPLRFGGGDDFYPIVGNDPLNSVDPFGLQAAKANPAPSTPPPPRPFIVPKVPPPPSSVVDELLDAIKTGASDVTIVVGVILGSATDLNSGENAALNQRNQDPQFQKMQQEHDAYHKRCDEAPPQGLDPCQLAKWKLQRNIDCRDLRKAWDDNYMPGRHANDIANLDRAIANLEAWIKKNCKQGCPAQVTSK